MIQWYNIEGVGGEVGWGGEPTIARDLVEAGPPQVQSASQFEPTAVPAVKERGNLRAAGGGGINNGLIIGSMESIMA